MQKIIAVSTLGLFLFLPLNPTERIILHDFLFEDEYRITELAYVPELDANLFGIGLSRCSNGGFLTLALRYESAETMRKLDGFEVLDILVKSESGKYENFVACPEIRFRGTFFLEYGPEDDWAWPTYRIIS